LLKTKRLGRYHNSSHSSSNSNDNSIPRYLSDEALLFRDIDYNKPFFESDSLQKVLANANKAMEKSTKFINKIKSRRLACADRAKSIPENATIRKEYIKCGKQMCEIEHGPYYYAYWKDPQSKKLKKKYIGDHMPDNKKSNDDSTNNLLL
jgi:hypothetical protein